MAKELPSAEEVARKLKISTAASVDAQAGLPDEAAQTLSETEVKIESFWKSEFDSLSITYNKDRHSTIQEMNEVVETINSISSFNVNDITNDMNATVTESQRTQAQLSKQLSDHQREYDDFRKSNDLVRTHKSPNPFVVYLTMAIFLFEAVINAVIYMPTMQGGGIAGAAVSISIALINVGYSYITGKYFITQWLLPRTGNKLIAILLAVLWAVIIFSVNMMAGLLRQITENQSENFTKMDFVVGAVADQMAIVFKPDQWPDLAFNSVLLIAVGIFFALIAIIDGWFCRDPYPGYARVGANLDETKQKIKAETEISVDNLREIFDEGMATLDGVSEDASEALNNLDKAINRLSELKKQKENNVKSILDRANTNILIYRNTNEQQRSSSNPKYFEAEGVSSETQKYMSLEDQEIGTELIPGGNAIENLNKFKSNFHKEHLELAKKLKQELITGFDKNNNALQS